MSLQVVFIKLFVIAIVLIVFIFPVWLVLLGGHRKFLFKTLGRCFDGIELHEFAVPGDVSFIYHTYRGLLIWFTQMEHRIVAPREDAERLLKRLLRFNLTWGMLSYGAIFIPFVVYGNYRTQLKSIGKQAAAQVD
jgi:hypothetical protein